MQTDLEQKVGQHDFYYWEYYALQMAFYNKEYCLCWENSPPSIKVSPSLMTDKNDPKYTEVRINLQCAKKKFTCTTNFSKTERELEIKFKDFYKGL